MTSGPDDGLTVTTITITRYLTPDGHDIIAHRIDGDDNVTMTLGMLALTQDTVLRAAGGEYDEEDEDGA